MTIESIYLNQVKSNPISRFCTSTLGGPEIERDPTISKLESEVFKKFLEISPPEQIPQKTNFISPVSVENAIKELLELEKASK